MMQTGYVVVVPSVDDNGNWYMQRADHTAWASEALALAWRDYACGGIGIVVAADHPRICGPGRDE